MQFKKGDVFATGSKTARLRVHIFCIFDDVAFFLMMYTWVSLEGGKKT